MLTVVHSRCCVREEARTRDFATFSVIISFFGNYFVKEGRKLVAFP